MARLTVAAFVLMLLTLRAEQEPARSAASVATEGDYVVHDYVFRSGERMSDVRLHYRTLGAPHRRLNGAVDNAVLILHGEGKTGEQFLVTGFAGELFGPGQLLDATRYFIILPDSLGHGGSSKPGDGPGTRFPRYGDQDIVDLQRKLLTDGLGVNHAALIMGTAMGGRHTWLWGERYSDFMSALMPIASVPSVETVGASSALDPSPNIAWVRVPLTVVNAAEDFASDADRAMLEKEIKRVRLGWSAVIPAGARTSGATYTSVAQWADELNRLLIISQPSTTGRAARASDVMPRTVAEAEAEGRTWPQDSVAASGPSQLIDGEFPGTPERRCVDVDQGGWLRSGDFEGGKFRGWLQQELFWTPHRLRYGARGEVPVFSLRMVRLDAQAPARVLEKDRSARSANVPVEKEKRFYITRLELPSPGKWMLVVTAGPHWGCFIETVER